MAMLCPLPHPAPATDPSTQVTCCPPSAPPMQAYVQHRELSSMPGLTVQANDPLHSQGCELLRQRGLLQIPFFLAGRPCRRLPPTPGPLGLHRLVGI